MSLPIPSTGTSNPQEFLTQSMLGNSRFQNQDYSPSTFLNLLRQDPISGSHNPFPRPLFESPEPFQPQESKSSSHSLLSFEQKDESKNLARDSKDFDEDSIQKNSANQVHKEKLDTLEANTSNKNPILDIDNPKALAEKNQKKDRSIDSLDNLEITVKDSEALGVRELNEKVTSAAEREGFSISDEHQHLSNRKERKDWEASTKNSEDTQNFIGSQLNSTKKLDGSPVVHDHEGILTEHTHGDPRISVKGEQQDTAQDSFGDLGQKIGSQKELEVTPELPQQVIEVVDLRTKQRAVSQKQQVSADQKAHQEERSLKFQTIRDLRNSNMLENQDSPNMFGNSKTTFGFTSDSAQTQMLEESGMFGIRSNESRASLTLGSESLLRFYDQKSIRPWTLHISRLFGRNINQSLGVAEGSLEILRNSSRETPLVQQQFRLDQIVQDQNRSIMNPSSADQAQVSQYLKAAGNAEILRSAKFILRDNEKGEIKLILKPERLGEIKIHLSLSNNSIEAQILVDNKEVEAAFAENLQELKQAFQDQGFDTGSFSITTREQKLASELLVEQQIQQVQIQEARWNELDPIQQEEIHIDLAI